MDYIKNTDFVEGISSMCQPIDDFEGIIKDKSLVSKYMTGRLNNSTTNNYNINVDSNNFVYYKNNKVAINKTPSNGVIHQRNFSSNSTNLNSLK